MVWGLVVELLLGRHVGTLLTPDWGGGRRGRGGTRGREKGDMESSMVKGI